MVQQVITYALVALSSFYIVYRSYDNLKKKKTCDKCELMKMAKLPKNTTS